MYAEDREIFGRLTSHLTTERREFRWNVFMEYREARLDIEKGMVQDIEAEFRVKGTTVKTPLRLMSQERTYEMSKQSRERFVAKVIEPSKSPRGAAPFSCYEEHGMVENGSSHRPVNKRMVNDVLPLPYV